MGRRKITAAALFFSLFGAIASLPPVVLLFRFDALIFGIPVENVYIFALWGFLIAGAVVFSRTLPREDSDPAIRQDREP